MPTCTNSFVHRSLKRKFEQELNEIEAINQLDSSTKNDQTPIESIENSKLLLKE